MFTILTDAHTTVSICWLAAFLARLFPLQESNSVRKTKKQSVP